MSRKNVAALSLIVSMLASPAWVLAQDEIAVDEVVVDEVVEVVAEEVEVVEEVAEQAEAVIDEVLETVEEVAEQAEAITDEELEEFAEAVDAIAEEVVVVQEVEEACVESIMDTQSEKFCRSHIIVIDSVGGSDGTDIKTFNPDLGVIWSYKLQKDKSQKDRGIWDANKTKVIRRTKRVYNSGLKYDYKYEGFRTFTLGILFEKLLGLTEHYDGTILLDEYKHYPLWNVVLRDREEVSDFLDYLLACLAKQGKRTFDRKPVLLLTLKNDPFFESLTMEDLAKLNMLFDVVDYRDTKTTEFFTKTQLTMDDLIMRFEGNDPKYLGEGTRKKLFRKFEKYFKDFDMGELFPWMVAGAASVFVVWYFEHKILKALRNRIPGPFDAARQNA